MMRFRMNNMRKIQIRFIIKIQKIIFAIQKSINIQENSKNNKIAIQNLIRLNNKLNKKNYKSNNQENS